ncbi:MAG: hypothetical protein ACYTFA_08305 [Planctomycetota bacterium]|jgi:hypothetical protein
MERQTSVAKIVILVALAGITGANGDTCTLKNDGFSIGGPYNCITGFVADEIGAATLGPVPETFQVESVEFLFCGATSTETITLKIYLETGGAAPGTLVYSNDFQVTGSEGAFHSIPLSAENIILPPGEFRVGIQMHHGGLPSIARDADGDIQTGRNWIYADGPGWVDAELFGIPGDFIIRAEISAGAGELRDFDGDGIPDIIDPDIDDDGVPNEEDVCDYTPMLLPAGLIEPDGSVRGDLDGDCDVDLDDYAITQERFTGPNPP